MELADFQPNLAPQPTKWLACWVVLELVCRADLLGRHTGQRSPSGATAGPLKLTAATGYTWIARVVGFFPAV